MKTVYCSERLVFETEHNISVVIAPNGEGKTYLLNKIKETIKDNGNNLGYTSKYIYEKYFSKFFPDYAKCGSGYRAIRKLCSQLSKPSSVIVINNPENYLHIEVQEAFLDAVVDLFGNTDVLVFIETHSPNILFSHLDLCCEAERLEEPDIKDSDCDDYVSVTQGDYSPSCPWNAPGMSVKDFI